MTSNGFPSSADQLTTQWLTHALRENGALDHLGSVAGFQVAPLEEPGQLADVCRVSLIYAGETAGAPQSLVAKFPAAHEQARQLARQYESYIKETRFYQELAGPVHSIVPLCYAAELEPETHDFVLLMEDLGDSRCGDFLSGEPADVAVALEHLAVLHARWWDHPALSTLEWPFRPDDPELSALLKAALAGLLPATRSMFGKYMSDEAWSSLQKALDVWDRTWAYQPGPYTICHGDCHLKQMMFPADDRGRFVLLDWQTTGVNWGAVDVARLLITSLSPDDRRIHEQCLVERYHRALKTQGVIDLDIDRLWLLIRYSAINTYIINALACLQTDAKILEDMCRERNINFYEFALGRVGAAADDWKLSEAIDQYLEEGRLAQAA